MIWTKYLLCEFLRLFFLVFFALFFLATLIDFSAHMKLFFQEGVGWIAILTYYFAQLSRQGEIFLCTALLLANIKVLTKSSIRGEVTALCTGGVPLRRLTYPLLGAALVASFLLYANSEFIQPKAVRHLALFEESFFKDTGKEEEVQTLVLEDQSRLLYSHFDSEKQRFIDLFWIKSADHILHMEELSPFDQVGFAVSTIKRENGELNRVDFKEDATFPKMHFERRGLAQATLPIQWQPLSQLFQLIPNKLRCKHDYEARAVTLFLQKLTQPLLALLVFLAPAPFCLRFGRNRRLFMLYALSLAFFLGYIAATQSFAILGRNLILPPPLAVLLLPCLGLSFFGLRYAKL